MEGAYVISPIDRTITYRFVDNAAAISRIVRPDYGVTTVRINKFGDCLHFDAEASDRPEIASFQLTGYLGRISGIALITGAVAGAILHSPVYDLDQIADLVRFDPPPWVEATIVADGNGPNTISSVAARSWRE